MTLIVLPTLILALTMEVAREICFKLAANQSEQGAANASYLTKLFGRPLVWLGFTCWGIELIAWIHVLGVVPLSIAYPMMSICYAGMIVASKYILKEEVSRTKWLGIGLITAGVALIGTQGGGL